MRRVLVGVAAVSIAVGGYVHFRLWHGVYHLAPIREMFVLNVVASAFLAFAILVPGRVTALAGVALSAGSLGAIALSRTVGLPTPHGRWTEVGLAPSGQTLFGISDTALVIGAETLALLACTALVVLAVRRTRTVDGRAGWRRTAARPQWAMPI